MYTPDFLIMQRKGNTIQKAIIVETKGKLYSNDLNFIARKDFTQGEWLKLNNKQFNYKRFEYLYLEDILTDKERMDQTHKAITKFFKEEI